MATTFFYWALNLPTKHFQSVCFPDQVAFCDFSESLLPDWVTVSRFGKCYPF